MREEFLLVAFIDDLIIQNEAVKEKKVSQFQRIIWKIVYSSEMTTSDKSRKGIRISESPRTIKFKKKIRFLGAAVTGAVFPYQLNQINTYDPISDVPVIFAVNHFHPADVPMSFKAIKRHCYILSGKQTLNLGDKLYFDCNGVIYVDRKSKEDSLMAKNAVEEYLKKGQDVLWFPEGAWNLTPNLPVMPLKWGIIDVARSANAQIIPLCLKYNEEEKTVSAKFGAPIYGDQLENYPQAIQNLRDSMASLWWDLISMDGEFEHSSNELHKIQTEILHWVTKFLTLNLREEQSLIFQGKNVIKPERVFEHLKHIRLTTDNAFLFNKRLCR